MARLLKQADKPEPGRWRALAGDAAARWRADVRKRMESAPRGQVTTEFDVGRREGLDEVPTLNRDTGIVERPKKEKPREALETVEVLTKMMLDNILSGTEEQRLQRIQLLKASSGMGHLSDAEALDQLSVLAEKLARRDAERRFAEMGLNTPVDLMGG